MEWIDQVEKETKEMLRQLIHETGEWVKWVKTGQSHNMIDCQLSTLKEGSNDNDYKS